MTDIRVSMDLLPFTKAITAAYKEQFPFGIARALTKTAKQAEEALREEADKEFVLRNKFLQKGIRINPATKRHLEAEVGTRDEILADHVTGRIRRNTRGRTVPTKTIRPIFSKKVPKSKYPARLIAKGGKRKPFFINGRKGSALVRRKRGKSGTLETLYRIPKRVEIKKRFELFKVVNRVVSKNWESNAIQSLEEAVRSAKR